jgi:hypothetical protein
VNPTDPTTHPSTSYDHSAGPPELKVSGEIGGRTAVFTLRPKYADSVDPGPQLGVAVRVATHFRIPLTFTATFKQVADERWELVRVLGDQDDYLASVWAVRPQVAAAAATVLEEQRAQMKPLLAVARERQAAYALAEVYRARSAAAEAHRRRTRPRTSSACSRSVRSGPPWCLASSPGAPGPCRTPVPRSYAAPRTAGCCSCAPSGTWCSPSRPRTEAARSSRFGAPIPPSP